ncbi:hypothetical protein AAY473_026349, partial [Plecturocebus cupreus]
MHQHARLIFVFLVETGFHYVGQAGLKLLTSGDPPASASQRAGITGSSNSPVSASIVAETTGGRHHARLSFCILVEMGFHHDAQAGQELLNSGNPPALTSQNARITGMSHCAKSHWANFYIFELLFLGQFRSVAQGGVQWRNLSSLQPLPPGFKHDSLHLAHFGSTSWPSLQIRKNSMGTALELTSRLDTRFIMIRSGRSIVLAMARTTSRAFFLDNRQSKTLSKKKNRSLYIYAEGSLCPISLILGGSHKTQSNQRPVRNQDTQKESHSVAQAGVLWCDLSSLKPLPPRFKVAGITGTCHHAQLMFVFSAVTGFAIVGQAGLELLTSSDLLTLAVLQVLGLQVFILQAMTDGTTEDLRPPLIGNFALVAQYGVQWCNLGSSQSPPPGLKLYSTNGEKRGSWGQCTGFCEYKNRVELLLPHEDRSTKEPSCSFTDTNSAVKMVGVFQGTVSLCCRGWSAIALSQLTATSVTEVQTGFHHVGQASLESLTLGDPPALASKSAGIIGVSHYAQPIPSFLK